jgi:hypothetical protein
MYVRDTENRLPNFLAKWLELLIRFPEISDLYHVPETGIAD